MYSPDVVSCESAAPIVAEMTDESLVLKFQQSGCSASLGELVGRHLRRVRSLAFSMLLDATQADDVAQDVFLRVVRALPGFRCESQFSTWLHRITWNVIQTALANSASKTESLNRVEDDSVCSQLPTDELLRRELHEQVERELRKLSPKLRAAIVLTTLQQLSAEEAAELEGCAVGTLYWRIHEARRQLQERLASYLDDK